jgi:hypothetical protein
MYAITTGERHGLPRERAQPHGSSLPSSIIVDAFEKVAFAAAATFAAHRAADQQRWSDEVREGE